MGEALGHMALRGRAGIAVTHTGQLDFAVQLLHDVDKIEHHTVR